MLPCGVCEGESFSFVDYLSYFSVAVIKIHDQDNLEKEEFIRAYGSKGIRI